MRNSAYYKIGRSTFRGRPEFICAETKYERLRPDDPEVDNKWYFSTTKRASEVRNLVHWRLSSDGWEILDFSNNNFEGTYQVIAMISINLIGLCTILR